MEVEVKAPLFLSDKEIESFLDSKEEWVVSKLEKEKKKEESVKIIEVISDSERNNLIRCAREIFPQKCKYYANIVGVSFGRITLRWQRSRFGSCSSKGNLNFNLCLMLAPEKILDYVVVHELCHRKEMNHSRAFWNEVGKVLPDYRESERWLKKNGELLMKRAGIL